MEIRKIIKEIVERYQYWRAPSCEACGLKLVDQGKYKILFEGCVFINPTWRFEIYDSPKGSIKFKEKILGAGSGVTWTIRDSSWCRQDAPSPWALIRPEIVYRRRPL